MCSENQAVRSGGTGSSGASSVPSGIPSVTKRALLCAQGAPVKRSEGPCRAMRAPRSQGPFISLRVPFGSTEVAFSRLEGSFTRSEGQVTRSEDTVMRSGTPVIAHEGPSVDTGHPFLSLRDLSVAQGPLQ